MERRKDSFTVFCPVGPPCCMGILLPGKYLITARTCTNHCPSLTRSAARSLSLSLRDSLRLKPLIRVITYKCELYTYGRRWRRLAAERLAVDRGWSAPTERPIERDGSGAELRNEPRARAVQGGPGWGPGHCGGCAGERAGFVTPSDCLWPTLCAPYSRCQWPDRGGCSSISQSLFLFCGFLGLGSLF